jgi:hypothetical protein
MNSETDASRLESPFSNVNTDRVLLVMMDLLNDGAIADKDAKKIINLYSNEGAAGINIKGFFPLTNEDEKIMNRECETASEKLLWMLVNEKILSQDAKKLLELYFGNLESRPSVKQNPPELPTVPDQSTIVVFRDRSRRRIAYTLDSYKGKSAEFKPLPPISLKANPKKLEEQ